MEYALIFILGLFFGSLANVLVLRLNSGESIVFSRSRCFACGRDLRWLELIPILSFIFLRGRCRNCGSKISWQYPVVELASGLLFLLLYFFEPNGPNPVWSIGFFWLLLVISVYDLRHKIIPNQLVYPAIVVSILFLIFRHWDLIRNLELEIRNLLPSILAGLALFLFFAILWAVSRGRWMGLGDAKMALALGLFLGWPETLAAFFFSFWLGAIAGLGWIIFNWVRGKKGVKGIQMPFAPFLFSGGLVAFLWGERIISWYASLL